MSTPQVPDGDDQFTAEAQDGGDEEFKKGAAGTDAQSRRNKGDDED